MVRWFYAISECVNIAFWDVYCRVCRHFDWLVLLEGTYWGG